MLTEQTEEHSYIYAGGKLLRETEFIVDEQGSEIERTFDFRYDNAGLPYALHYTDTFEGIEQTYYYITNLQGDVMYMVDEGGDEVASYDYDPYGKLLYARGDMAEVNPIRYRGYYYDNDTDFYYLQSRYYDPAICRFINHDSYAATGQGIVGYNMFAYCSNDPINNRDMSGSWPNWINNAANWVNQNVIKPINENIIEPVTKFVTGIAEDIKNFDINNESEAKVLESNYFSCYKGVPVVRTNLNRSGSFGIIFLKRKENYEDPKDVVRHEYGHTQQLKQLGVIKFAIYIGIPSWLDLGTGDYYDKPWEVTADIYGGVQSRTHDQKYIDDGFAYLNQVKNKKKRRHLRTI